MEVIQAPATRQTAPEIGESAKAKSVASMRPTELCCFPGFLPHDISGLGVARFFCHLK
jgi:hypothetical protein